MSVFFEFAEWMTNLSIVNGVVWLAVLLVPHIVAIFQGKVQSPGVDVSGASGSYLPQFLFYSSFTVATNPEYPTMYASTVRFDLRLYLGCSYTSGRCLTRLTLLPPPQVLFYLLFYIFFSMRYYVNQRRDWATPQTPPSPHPTSPSTGTISTSGAPPSMQTPSSLRPNR